MKERVHPSVLERAISKEITLFKSLSAVENEVNDTLPAVDVFKYVKEFIEETDAAIDFNNASTNTSVLDNRMLVGEVTDLRTDTSGFTWEMSRFINSDDSEMNIEGLNSLKLVRESRFRNPLKAFSSLSSSVELTYSTRTRQGLNPNELAVIKHTIIGSDASGRQVANISYNNGLAREATSRMLTGFRYASPLRRGE